MATSRISSIQVKHPDRLFIGGKWTSPTSGASTDVVSPFTEETIFQVATAGQEDIGRAVAAARRAFDEGPWPRLSHEERAEYLRRFAEGIRARGEELGLAWTEQVGVLRSVTAHAAQIAASRFDMYANMASTFPFIEEHKPAAGTGRALLVREPVGVVAAIVAWNAPLGLACNKIAPALLAGCTVVLKPSSETPIEAYILAEVAESVGLPEGVFNVVVAARGTSECLVNDPRVDKISFTGSSEVGKRIASLLGSRMARYTMELGGKSAAIVLDDFSVEDAVKSLSSSLCSLNGQVCAALTRVIVPQHRRNEFVDGFAETLGAIRIGDPYDPTSQLGPIALRRQLARVEHCVERGKAEGAQLVVGGGRPSHLNKGFYFEPTLFADVEPSMFIAQEEIFGPVLCLMTAENDDDAIRIANSTPYGLNGSVLTHDNERAYDVARRLQAGNVSQNGFRMDMTIAFGGFKESGVGREGGTEGLLSYCEAKTLLLD